MGHGGQGKSGLELMDRYLSCQPNCSPARPEQFELSCSLRERGCRANRTHGGSNWLEDRSVPCRSLSPSVRLPRLRAQCFVTENIELIRFWFWPHAGRDIPVSLAFTHLTQRANRCAVGHIPGGAV